MLTNYILYYYTDVLHIKHRLEDEVILSKIANYLNNAT